MKTFTIVDGVAYPGTLIREAAIHPVYGPGFYSYLSADLGNRGWVHVEKWDEPKADVTSEEEVRNALQTEIIKKCRASASPDA